MEHFEEGPGRCLMEAHRILKKDGILVLSVPYQNVYRGTVRRFFTMPLLKLLKPKFRNKYRVFYQYYFSRRDLMKFLRKANFLPVEWFYMDRFHTSNQRAGIALEFPFLRKRNGVQWEVKPVGIFLARLAEAISKSIFAAGIVIVARKQ